MWIGSTLLSLLIGLQVAVDNDACAILVEVVVVVVLMVVVVVLKVLNQIVQMCADFNGNLHVCHDCVI